MRGEGSHPPAPWTAVPGEGGQGRCRPAVLQLTLRAVSHVVQNTLAEAGIALGSCPFQSSGLPLLAAPALCQHNELCEPC